jgi:hypothetical protein
MNYDNENHIIEYIEGKKVKQFQVPKNDYNLDFNKMSYNDILTYIKLVQEQEQQDKTKDKIKYKPLKTVAAKTKDYFDRNEKLMSQVERQQKIAEFIISDKPENVTEILQDDTNYDNPFIKSLVSSLFEKGYSNEKIKELLKENDYFEVNSIEINNCIIKDDETYYFEDYEFKNTIHDLLNDSRQISILKYNEIFVPVNNIYNGDIVVSDNKKNKKFTLLNELLFKGVDFRTNEGIIHKAFFNDKFVSRRDTQINYNKFVIPQGESSFNLDLDKTPFYLYNNDTKDKIYLNIQLLYYLLQFNLSFQNNNYKYIVEKINKYKEDKHKIKNVILIAGSAFDLDHIFDSLDEKNNDTTTDYYNEYINLFAQKITYLFNQHLKNYSLTHKTKISIRKPKTIPVLTIPEKPEPVEPEEPEPVEPVKLIHIKEPKVLVATKVSEDDILTDDDVLTDDETNDLIPVEEKPKEAKGLFRPFRPCSSRRDTRETLKALLNRIIKLESLVSVQADEIKQLKNGIKSINQALPNETRKEVFGNYFSNSVGGALNPNKVYPKITFTEFKKLYNEL